ncbi:PEGA domain-containing protein [Brevundimonas sp. Bb-A]|uniref:PEGA domain-containing protein n=1 Tax=Brevundimonas sp. Bb-A TaxID=2560058 RepID=UPI00128F4E77|nr:PEGA domain-containing protein [Brevundimonas sp. Bb-A]QFU30267.1 hypothetical protein BSP_01190 [Brevundimonas sp. Bb-A]
MIVVYDQQGRIQYTVDDPYPPELEETYSALEAEQADFNYHDEPQADIIGCYVDMVGRVVTPRPEMDVAVTGATLSNLPAGATVAVDSVFVVEDAPSAVTLEAVDAGAYSVRVSKWPYLDFETTMELTP